MDLSFRTATEADVPAIVSLVESAFRGDTSRAGWTTEADLLDGRRTDEVDVRELVAGPSTRITLCERDGALIGCVMLKDEGTAVYLGMLSVSPTIQSGGIGHAIMREAERIARDELARPVMRMRVIAQRPELLEWYARRGYSRSGETEPFPYGDPRFGLPRRDDLVFVVLRKDLR